MGNSSHSFSNYNYDGFNRTTKVETFDGNVQINRYDAEGLRYEMEENNNLVQFIFNQNREVIAEQETTWTSYIRGSTLLASSAEHARTYYHYASDEMSSITHIVNDEKVLNEYEYDAWGEVVSQKETVKNRFKFNGQQLDPITQQYYLRARFYNPVIARFTQEDTYRGDGLNLYAYCRNNPTYYVDPTGNVCDSAADRIRETHKDIDPNTLSGNDLKQYQREELQLKIYDRIQNFNDGTIENRNIVTPPEYPNPVGSSYKERFNQTPTDNPKKKKGDWTDTRGESNFNPNNSYSSSKYNYGDVTDRMLSDHGVDSISYKNSQVNFNPVAEISFDMGNQMQGGRGKAAIDAARKDNFRVADQMLADLLGINKTEATKLRENNGFTWHEMNDGRTIQFVSSDINALYGHLGGISELR